MGERWDAFVAGAGLRELSWAWMVFLVVLVVALVMLGGGVGHMVGRARAVLEGDTLASSYSGIGGPPGASKAPVSDHTGATAGRPNVKIAVDGGCEGLTGGRGMFEARYADAASFSDALYCSGADTAHHVDETREWHAGASSSPSAAPGSCSSRLMTSANWHDSDHTVSSNAGHVALDDSGDRQEQHLMAAMNGH